MQTFALFSSSEFSIRTKIDSAERAGSHSLAFYLSTHIPVGSGPLHSGLRSILFSDDSSWFISILHLFTEFTYPVPGLCLHMEAL